MAWSVGMAFSGAALAVAFPVFPVLCVSALMTGGATGVAVIALQRHVGRAAGNPTQLKQVFGWLSIGPAVSNFIGPFAAGLLIDHAGPSAGSLVGYQAAFALMAVLLAGHLGLGAPHPRACARRVGRRCRQAARAGPAAPADDGSPAAGELAARIVLGCAHLCRADPGPRARLQRFGDRIDPRCLCHRRRRDPGVPADAGRAPARVGGGVDRPWRSRRCCLPSTR